MADNELFGISEQLNDLISRRAAVDAKNIVHIEMFGRDFPVVPVETLKVLPPVDAVPVVHGYWIKFGVSDKDGNQLYRCSVCKCEEIHSPLVKVNYCWNCGALMKWWEDGEHEQDKKS